MTKPGIKFKKFVIFLLTSFFIFSSLSLAELAFKLIKTEPAASQPGFDEFFIYFNKKTDSLKFKSFLRKNRAKEDVLIFEFYNTNSLIPYKTLPLKKNGIIKAVTAQFESSPPVGRVVFYLQEKKNFEVSREGNLIKIILAGPGQIKTAADKTKTKTPAPALSETAPKTAPKTAAETAAKTAQPPPAKTQPEIQPALRKLNIEGYKLWNFSRVNISPAINLLLAQTYFEGIRPTPYGRLFDWREKLKLKIDGQVSDKISVAYDLLQDPDTPPDQYNITVTYDKTKLTFGDFTASLGGNEFATLNKSVNGVMLDSRDAAYEATLISAKDRSNSKTDVFTGNGSKGPYKLSNSFIIENSEIVFLNSNRLTRNRDYFINYYEGEITFPRLLSEADRVEVKYEYSSIIDLFFQGLSKKELAAARVKINWENFLNQKETTAGDKTPAGEPEQPQTVEEQIQGRNSRGPYFLKHRPILEKSEAVSLNGQVLLRGLDYQIDYRRGKITFLINVSQTADAAVAYQFIPEQKSKNNLPVTSFSTGVTYIKESAPSSESTGVLSYNETQTVSLDSQGQIDRDYQLAYFPLVPDSETIKLNGQTLIKNIDYTLDYEKGQLNFSPSRPLAVGQTIGADYKYYKSFYYNYITTGKNSLDPYYLPFRPVVYASEIVRIKELGADNFKNLRKWDGTLSPDLYNTGEIVYSIDYQNGGLEFKQLDDRGLFLPYLVPTTTAISIDFRYTQQDTTSQLNLSSQLVGLDSNLKIPDWDFKINAAQSDSNQASRLGWQTDTFTGTGEKTYTLSKIPVTDSEIVQVNGSLLTRETDYIISYSGQKITFFKYAPTQLDTISVRYQYQLEAGGAFKKGRAVSLDSKGSLGNLNIEGNYKNIDPAFFSVGSTTRGAGGSRDEVLKLAYNFSEDFSADFGYEKYLDQIDEVNQTPIYLITDRKSYGTTFKSLNLGTLSLSLADTINYDQVLTGSHNYDTKRKDLKAAFSFGPSHFSSLIEAVRTTSLTDFLDQSDQNDFVSYFWRGKNSWQVLENLSLTTDLQRLESKTAKIARDITKRQTVDAVDLKLKYEPLTCLSTESAFFWQRINPHDEELKVSANKKLAYRFQYQPGPFFNFNFTQQEEEKANVFQNQAPVLSSLRNLNSTIKPWEAATLNLGLAQNSSSEGTNRNYDSSNFFTSLSYFLTRALELQLKLNHLAANSFSSPQSQNSFDKIYSANLNYFLTPQITLKSGVERDYFLSSESSLNGSATGLSLSGQTGIEVRFANGFTTGLNFKAEDYKFNSEPLTRTRNYYTTASLGYAAGEKISLTFLLNQNYISDLINTRTRPTTEAKSSAKIELFKNSFLNFDYERQDTSGKIKKRTIEDINSLKQSISAGLDFVIPLESVPRGLTISAKIKRLAYADRGDSKNNFTANVIMGEVKLDF